ncbi:MAG: hypothetical protein ABIU18_06075 [Novosphingobium sp.]
MIGKNLMKIGAAATALCFAVPSVAQPVAEVYPAPAPQAVYPPCSATVTDQCTNTRREADEKASTSATDSTTMVMPMHHKRQRHHHHHHHTM